MNTGIRRFNGNPLIDARPPLSDTVRTVGRSTLADIIYPSPSREKIARDLEKIIRESHVVHCPLNITGITGIGKLHLPGRRVFVFRVETIIHIRLLASFGRRHIL